MIVQDCMKQSNQSGFYSIDKEAMEGFSANKLHDPIYTEMG